MISGIGFVMNAALLMYWTVCLFVRDEPHFLYFNCVGWGIAAAGCAYALGAFRT